MSTTLWLTDEDADLSGFKRALLGRRSDCPSLVRAATSTAAGPTSGIAVTRSAGGAELAWITEPLDGTDLTASAWEVHLWAWQSSASLNAALRVRVHPWSSGAEQAAALDDNPGTALPTTARDSARSTAAATATALAAGDRLVVRALVDDAAGGALQSGGTVTLSFNGQYPYAEGDSYLLCPDNLALLATVPSSSVTRLRNEIKDVSTSNPNLTDAELRQHLNDALAVYSRDRPREVQDALSGDGTSFDFPLPRNFVWGWSTIRAIEYPAGEQVANLLDHEDWQVLERTLGRQPQRVLRFTNLVPESGTDNVLVTYTTRHQHSTLLDTVPSEDLPALIWLAASFAATALAGRGAQVINSSGLSDSTDRRGETDNWLAAARQFRKLYDQHLGGAAGGGGGGAPRPASGWTEWDSRLSSGGDFLWHPRRYR